MKEIFQDQASQFNFLRIFGYLILVIYAIGFLVFVRKRSYPINKKNKKREDDGRKDKFAFGKGSSAGYDAGDERANMDTKLTKKLTVWEAYKLSRRQRMRNITIALLVLLLALLSGQVFFDHLSVQKEWGRISQNVKNDVQKILNESQSVMHTAASELDRTLQKAEKFAMHEAEKIAVAAHDAEKTVVHTVETRIEKKVEKIVDEKLIETELKVKNASSQELKDKKDLKSNPEETIQEVKKASSQELKDKKDLKSNPEETIQAVHTTQMKNASSQELKDRKDLKTSPEETMPKGEKLGSELESGLNQAKKHAPEIERKLASAMQSGMPEAKQKTPEIEKNLTSKHESGFKEVKKESSFVETKTTSAVESGLKEAVESHPKVDRKAESIAVTGKLMNTTTAELGESLKVDSVTRKNAAEEIDITPKIEAKIEQKIGKPMPMNDDIARLQQELEGSTKLLFELAQNTTLEREIKVDSKSPSKQGPFSKKSGQESKATETSEPVNLDTLKTKDRVILDNKNLCSDEDKSQSCGNGKTTFTGNTLLQITVDHPLGVGDHLESISQCSGLEKKFPCGDDKYFLYITQEGDLTIVKDHSSLSLAEEVVWKKNSSSRRRRWFQNFFKASQKSQQPCSDCALVIQKDGRVVLLEKKRTLWKSRKPPSKHQKRPGAYVVKLTSSGKFILEKDSQIIFELN